MLTPSRLRKRNAASSRLNLMPRIKKLKKKTKMGPELLMITTNFSGIAEIINTKNSCYTPISEFRSVRMRSSLRGNVRLTSFLVCAITYEPTQVTIPLIIKFIDQSMSLRSFIMTDAKYWIEQALNP